MRSSSVNENPSISIATLVEAAPRELELSVVAGRSGLESRMITSDRIQKLGLALAGFPDYVHAGRIQIVGQSELSYLDRLSESEKHTALARLEPSNICSILLTKNLTPPPELHQFAETNGIPLLQTSLVSSRAIRIVTKYLEEVLAPQITVHGVLIGMYGIGVLLLGNSGIGKSECALDLISRGHRLISDDSVQIRRIGTHLVGDAPELIRDHLEIHGLGIVNIRNLFGVSSIGDRINIELAIELKNWDDFESIERLGLEMKQEEIFSLPIGKYILPVSPGRNLAILVETAVRIYLLKRSGYDAAQVLIEKHTAKLAGR